MEIYPPPHQKTRVTSIAIQPWLSIELEKRGMKLSHLAHNALEWKDRLEEQGKELLKQNQKLAELEAQNYRLMRENIDLLRFRVKAIEKLYGKEKE